MADSNLPKQDFAPSWLKFPSTDSPKSSIQSNYQSDRSSQRREEHYYSQGEYSHLQRQTSFDFHDGSQYPPSQGKYRHHSVDDDYHSYHYGGYGCYAPSYSYEKYSMTYGSQPSLTRSGSRDERFSPGHFYQQGSTKRGYHDKDSRDTEAKSKERSGDQDTAFSEDFPSLRGIGEVPEVKQAKPASGGVWDNPPKSNRSEESADLIRNTPTGIYKALVPCKNGQLKKIGREAQRMNGNIKDSSPLSPTSKSSHREITRQSPTPDLTIMTQPKKLGDKKSEFLRALRNESNLRSGDKCQDLNQNSLEKRQNLKELKEKSVNDNAAIHCHFNVNEAYRQNSVHVKMINGNRNMNGNHDRAVNGENNGDLLIQHVDHIYLSGEEEEKRLLESMGWSEEDKTEYVITDDDVREFQHMLNRVSKQKEYGNPERCSVLRLKLGTHFANGLLNGPYQGNITGGKHES